MPPKKQQANTKKAAPKKNNKKEDDELEFLNAALKENNKATQELDQKKKEDKKKDNEKKQAQEKIQRALDAEKSKAIAALPPMYVDEVLKQLYEKNGGEGNKDQFREMCHLHFALFALFNMAVESKRKLLFRSAEHPKGEALATFECHDLTDADDSPHSWLVFTTASGNTYCADLTIKQFEPKGRYGHQRDANEALGCVPVPGPSRLLGKNGEPHKGSICKDGGLFPEVGEGKEKVPQGKTTLIAPKGETAAGVPEGTTKNYAKFLKAAQSGRHQDMPASEARSARILFKNKVGRMLAEIHEELEDYWFTKPLAAAAEAAKEAKAAKEDEAK